MASVLFLAAEKMGYIQKLSGKLRIFAVLYWTYDSGACLGAEMACLVCFPYQYNRYHKLLPIGMFF